MLRPTRISVTSLLFCAVLSLPQVARGQDSVAADLAKLMEVGPAGAGHTAGREAVANLSKLPPERIGEVLRSFSEASPLVKNWLRVVVASISENGDFPREELLAFFRDRRGDTDARHLAFQLLISDAPDSLPELIEGGETDPSLPVRHLAISRLLERAGREQEAKEEAAAIATLRVALAEGRNPDQLKATAAALEKLGQTVDLAQELGMIRNWWAFGTYDNADSAHFATVYPPESVYLAQGRLPAEWLREGAAVKTGSAADDDAGAQTAQRVTSDDSLGMVNLNPTFANAKDSVAYAYVEFELGPEFFSAGEGSEGARIAQARLGCITANKVWVNGELVTANEVYHSGTRIDQYVGECRLVPGLNTVLIKILQNAQTEPWAQDWQFQYRFTDLTGAGLGMKLSAPATE